MPRARITQIVLDLLIPRVHSIHSTALAINMEVGLDILRDAADHLGLATL
jgi:hypothetical protein